MKVPRRDRARISAAVLLILLSLGSLYYYEAMRWPEPGPVRDELTIIIPRSLIATRDVQVQWATLSVPGLAVLPGHVEKGSDEIVVRFRLGELARRAGGVDSGAGMATATVVLVDYSNGTRIAVAFSSLNYAALLYLGHARDARELEDIAWRVARADPVLLLRAGEIVVTQPYLDVLWNFGDVAYLGYKPAQPVEECDLPLEGPGTGMGVYRIVDQELLDELRRAGPPDWWLQHYHDTPEGPSAEEAYYSLAERLLASVYLASKDAYPTPGDAVLAARRAALPVWGDALGLIPMSALAAPDRWLDRPPETMVSSVPAASITVTVQHDARASVELDLSTVTWSKSGAHAGLYYMGVPVALTENSTVFSASWGAGARPGEAETLALYLDGARITTGPDVLLIAWEIQSCGGYYLIKPVPTVATLYTVDTGTATPTHDPESPPAPLMPPTWTRIREASNCTTHREVGIEREIAPPKAARIPSIFYEPGPDLPPLEVAPHTAGSGDPLALNYARYASTLLLSPSFRGEAAILRLTIEVYGSCARLDLWAAAPQARLELAGEPLGNILVATVR